MTITLTVAGRIATVDATTQVVAGNTYPVTLSLDSEWTGSLYLRVRFGSLYYDIPFASSAASVDVQMPVGYPEVGIGVFSEALEICTSEARVRLLRSILEAGEQVVEFDSDLYDQWAGEVSELLCDDAFDSTSDRPVKNSVITAWKNTVPLDSALVHKTGNESVAGQKTFTDVMALSRASEPILNLKSGLAYSAEGFRSEVTTTDIKDGAESRLTQVISRVQPTSSQYDVRVYKPDRSGFYDMDLRSYSDHFAILVPTYYPVDGSSNPQPLTANALITSGNLAVDPRIVHTTGNETVAGNKDFTGVVTHQSTAPTINLRSTSAVDSEGVKSNIVFYSGTSNVRGQMFQQRDSASEFVSIRQTKVASSGYHALTLKCSNTDLGWAEAPTYTADNFADGKIVTRSMLATTPTVVHTTGNEAVAGVKTFAKPASLAIHESSSNNQWGWRKMLVSPSFSNQNDVNLAVFELTSNTGHHARFQLNGRNASLTGISMVFGNYDPANVKVSRDSNGEVIVWCRAYRTVATLVYEVHAGSNSVTFVDSGTTSIFDEPTTDTYAQVIQPSN